MELWTDWGISLQGSLHQVNAGFVRLPPRLIVGFRSKPRYRVQAGREEVAS